MNNAMPAVMSQQVGYHLAIDMDDLSIDSSNINIFTAMLDKIVNRGGWIVVHAYAVSNTLIYILKDGYIIVHAPGGGKILTDMFLDNTQGAPLLECVKQQVLSYCAPTSYRVVIKARGATNSASWRI